MLPHTLRNYLPLTSVETNLDKSIKTKIVLMLHNQLIIIIKYYTIIKCLKIYCNNNDNVMMYIHSVDNKSK